MNFDININPGDLIEITRSNPKDWIFKFLVISIGEPEFTRFYYPNLDSFDDVQSELLVRVPINLSTVETPRSVVHGSVVHEDGYIINIGFSVYNNDRIAKNIRLKLSQVKSGIFSIIYNKSNPSIHASINGNQIDLNKLISIGS